MSKQEDLVTKIKVAVEQLRAELGRNPSYREPAAKCNLTYQQIYNLSAAIGFQPSKPARSMKL